MLLPFLFTLPWLLVCGQAVRIRLPRPLPGEGSPRSPEEESPKSPGEGADEAVTSEQAGPSEVVDILSDRSQEQASAGPASGGTAGTAGAASPQISVIVPARDEARSIKSCVASISASEHPSFEIIVVDDRSTDDTHAIASRVPIGNARRVEVLSGEELPEGWLGKPWACYQGAQRARGRFLLFTDADTTHTPTLMASAVSGLRQDGAQAITLVGQQRMESFWERLVQPQIFTMMMFRYLDLGRPVGRDRWRDAIANGQYILIERETYDDVGGHEAVRGEVVEDLALAQILARAGLRLTVRLAERQFRTRMYRSLREIVDGWSKNVILGGLMTLPAWLRPIMPPAVMSTIIALWIAPPIVLSATLVGFGSGSLQLWAAATTAISVSFWMAVNRRFGAPLAYGLAYPLGAAVAAFIFVRSWTWGRDIRWKGRSYRIDAA